MAARWGTLDLPQRKTQSSLKIANRIGPAVLFHFACFDPTINFQGLEPEDIQDLNAGIHLIPSWQEGEALPLSDISTAYIIACRMR